MFGQHDMAIIEVLATEDWIDSGRLSSISQAIWVACSQLTDFRLTYEKTDAHIWMPWKDKQRLEALPVLLAFSLAADQHEQAISLSQQQKLDVKQTLPPSRLGELALIAGKHNERPIWKRCTIEELDGASQRLQQRLGDTLSRLEAAHNLERSAWLERWKEIQQIARQLAADYLNAVNHGPRPYVPNMFTEGAAWAFADEVLAAITNGMRNNAAGGSRWKQASAQEDPYYPEGNVILRILPEQANEKSVLEPHPLLELALTKRAQVLKDQDISNLITLLVHWITAPETSRVDGYLWTEVSTILDYRGLAPKQTIEHGQLRRAGHQEQNILAVIDSIERLAYLWATVEVKITGPRSGKVRDGRVIELKNRWRAMRMQEDGTLHEQTTMWLWKPGDALEGITSKGIFLQQIVQYDHHSERWELALALIFTILLSFWAKGTKGAYEVDHVYEIRVGTLLEKGSLLENMDYVRLHPKEMARTPFEGAMNRLEADGIIAGWRYQESVEHLPRKGWLDAWLGYHVQVKIGRLLLDPPGGVKGYRQVIEAKKARRERPTPQPPRKGRESKQQSNAPR